MNKYEGYDEETRRKLEEFDRMEERRAAKSARKKEHRSAVRSTFEWLTEPVMAQELRRTRDDYYWDSRQSLHGLGSGKQHVDVFGQQKQGSQIVYIEIEGGQSRPVSNTAKVWRYLENGGVTGPLIFIQLFSPYYEQSEGVHHTRMEEAMFIGQQAQRANKAISYSSLGPDVWPADRAELRDYVNRISQLIP